MIKSRMEDLGLGIDILEIERIKKALNRFGERFLERIFSRKEREAMPEKNTLLYYALGFSFKEAVWKALPEEMQKSTHFRDIAIYWREREPSLRIRNLTLPCSLSFSLDKGCVVTIAFLTAGE